MGRNSDRARWCTASSTDWSLLELGHFDQVIRTLEAQGVQVEVKSGMTDEGEPWLVFCDAESGEVLCHCARLGNSYIACIPFDDAGTTGAALAEVLDDFFSTCPRRVAPWASQDQVSHEKL